MAVTIRSVQWGIMSVVSRRDIMDPTKGVGSRAILRGFDKTYLKDADYHLDSANMAKIKTILEAFPENDKENGPEPKKLKKS